MQTFGNKKDGFKLLIICLQTIFPHMGAPPINLIKEINAITITHGDTLNTIYSHMICLKRRFEMSVTKVINESKIHVKA